MSMNKRQKEYVDIVGVCRLHTSFAFITYTMGKLYFYTGTDVYGNFMPLIMFIWLPCTMASKLFPHKISSKSSAPASVSLPLLRFAILTFFFHRFLLF